MKISIVAFALVASAMTGIAHAEVHTTSTQPQVGKTRAEVKRELVQAQKNGQIAALANLYRGS
ncbi:DUF4148 domain-containing protein [Caballeronia sp. GACF4]|uniref:DUF4148 domain-containing protein n=1 Tax=Caballeronia sp. GACF4 TaxID=2921763 RepID=UPI0020295B40|nr:DUF4148 domain-containing protein [Caballeronia sp. GACF4]